MGNYDDFTAYFNGEWVPYSEVRFPPHDRGFAVADVVFDQGRTFGGVPFRLEDHINRLYRSLKYVRVDPGLTEEEMVEMCREGVARNDHRRDSVGDFAINPIITRGTSVEWATASVAVIIKPIDFKDFAQILRGWGPRHRDQGAELLQRDARCQGEAPQQDELRAGGTRGPGRGPRGFAPSNGHGRERHRGARIQRFHRYGRSAEDSQGRQHPAGRIPTDRVRSGRGSRDSGFGGGTCNHTTFTRRTRCSSAGRVHESCQWQR